MNTTLRIENHPTYCNTDSPGRITSVAESIQQRLVKFEKLTHSKAIQILKKIKWEADIQSLMCKPIVHLPLLTMLTIGSYVLITSTNYLALFILGMASSMLTSALLGTCLVNIFRFLNASTAYNEKSKEASRYIDILENSFVEMQVIV